MKFVISTSKQNFWFSLLLFVVGVGLSAGANVSEGNVAVDDEVVGLRLMLV